MASSRYGPIAKRTPVVTTTSELVAFLSERPQAGIAGPRMCHADGTLYRNSQRFLTLPRMFFQRIGWSARFSMSQPLNAFEASHETDYVIGSFLVCRTKVLHEVGWFDSSTFLFGEDQDLCRRVRARGWEVWYANRGAVVHDSGHSWQQLDDRGRSAFREARTRELRVNRGRFQALVYRGLSAVSERR